MRPKCNLVALVERLRRQYGQPLEVWQMRLLHDLLTEALWQLERQANERNEEATRQVGS